MSVFSQVASFWTEGTIGALNAYRNGFGAPENDPPAVTPYKVIYEGGKVSLRYYAARGEKQHRIPILLTFALIKRPFILDFAPGRSLIELLINRGFDVYFIDWIPPDENDTWRGFDAYVNGDMVDAVRAVQRHSGKSHINLIGYCFGGLLSLIYTALHPDNVKNLVTITLPLDMSKRDLPTSNFVDAINPKMIDNITALYGNCPAWMMNQWFSYMAPTYHALEKYVDLYRNYSKPGYPATHDMFEKWINSDVPLAGQIFRELIVDISKGNKLYRNAMRVGERFVDLKTVVCPVLNMIADYDNIVAPSQSVGLPELIGSTDKRNIHFPTGHMGAAVSQPALKKLWPEMCTWLAERD